MNGLDGYLTAWLCYLLAALGLCWVAWRISSQWTWHTLKKLMRMLLVVVLFTPVNISDSGTWFVPAYLVGGYEWILGNLEQAQPALLNLGIALAVGVGILLLDVVIKKLLHLNAEG